MLGQVRTFRNKSFLSGSILGSNIIFWEQEPALLTRTVLLFR